MRRPSPRSIAVAVTATSLALLPFTGASAAFDDGDYDLSTDCGIDATLQVRGNGNGISVRGDATLAVGKERVDGEVVGAFVIGFGDDETADDNTVYTVRPEDEGLSCTFAVVTDDEAAELLGIDDLEAEDEDATSTDVESEASEDSADADDDGEAAEKVILCHKPEGANPIVIEPSIDALQAHLDHGDFELDDAEGDCPEPTSLEGEEAGDADQQGNAAAQEKRAERDAAKAERDAARAERKNGQDPSQD